MEKRALGRGLNALITRTEPQEVAAGEPLRQVPIAQVLPWDDQPRKHIATPELEELAQSIREKGIIQPLIVRRDGNRYRLIAGERRWRAASLAGLSHVPVILRDVADSDALECALIENIQRADLNPIEEAATCQRLIDDRGYTQAQLAEKLGKERTSVANSLRLLKLPSDIRDRLAAGQITTGHAKVLLSICDEEMQRHLARKVVDEHLSVRQLEGIAAPPSGDDKTKENPATKAADSISPPPDTHLLHMQENLQRALGTKIKITDHGGRGKVQISFFSYQDLQRIYEALCDDGV